jgi:hypothetical protein
MWNGWLAADLQAPGCRRDCCRRSCSLGVGSEVLLGTGETVPPHPVMSPHTGLGCPSAVRETVKDFQYTFRNGAKIVVSPNLRQLHAHRRSIRFTRALAGKPTSEIFSYVYSKQIWGGSGGGSHYAFIVEPYITAISRFAAVFPKPLDAVDLGCGDFAIGSRLRPLFNGYVAGDIVPDVIVRNRKRYTDLDVDFRVIDFTADELPPGDVVFVRLVLQHLSNDEIARTVTRLRETYPRLILTEHLPLATDFVPNIDVETGPGIRLGLNSGVDITKPPFEVAATSATVLCEVLLEENALAVGRYRYTNLSPPSRIRTTLYEF